MYTKDIVLDFLSENKKPFPELSFESLISLISEQMEEQGVLLEEKEKSKGPTRVPTGARARDRVLRLPNVVATEISVGQRPSSEDRSQFELWMRNLGMASGGGDSSAVAAKLNTITNFFDNPEANLSNATLPQTLSYLMFLNQFVWMIKEFNASVAGFLWEPFLASLFGGKSEQVPTSKGDIADIKIYPGGSKKGESISLKILNETGQVKGSFRDLVNHFAQGGASMRYVIVVKDQSETEKEVSAVTFYEFDITAQSFFDWIGTVEYEEVAETATQTFTLNRPGKANLKMGHTKAPGPDPEKPDRPETFFWIRHAKRSTGKKQVTKWYKLGRLNAKTGLVQISPATAELINLQGVPPEGLVDPEKTKLTADLALHAGGGVGGATVRKKFTKEKGATDELFGTATSATNKLWGSVEELGQWAKLRDEGWDGQKLFQAIQNGVTLPDGTVLEPAPGVSGAKGETQFHISPALYTGMAGNAGGDAGKLGTLRITTKKVEDFFKLAANQMNDDLIIMFNSLADLTDNIGRFFLVDCGGDACTEDDAADRHLAGLEAIEDASKLEAAVVKSVKSVK
tara:strand:+ start:2350 stop:4062 length:1713 start_codon:yes stop_codon:yes gene_type:complete